MAVAKTFLKISENEAVIKIAGTGSTSVISLATDLLASTQTLNGAIQTVDITGVTFSGENATLIQIVRNSVIVMTLPSSASNFYDFSGQMMPAENTQNTKDISVTISGGQGEVWIRVRKTTGYKSKIEYGLFGSYDDPTVTGS